MKRTERGTYDYAIDDHGNAVVTWHNTAVVTCDSNYTAGLPESSVSRWSKTKQKKINIPMPDALKQYNQIMGQYIYLISL